MFFLFGKVENSRLLKRVHLAWDDIHSEDEALLDRNDASAGIPYTRWDIRSVETLTFPYPREESFC